jgi:hypothetical protein
MDKRVQPQQKLFQEHQVEISLKALVINLVQQAQQLTILFTLAVATLQLHNVNQEKI